MTPLPKKPAAAFHHPVGYELYSGLAMDLHAVTHALNCTRAQVTKIEEAARQEQNVQVRMGMLCAASMIRERGHA